MATRSMKLLVAATAVLGLLATACGSGGGGDEKVTLRYAYWGPNQTPAMKQVKTAFEKEHPNVTVRLELTPFDQYFTKLQTATTGGDEPDVFWLNAPNFPTYAANDKLLDQSDMTGEGGLDESNYPEPVMNLYEWDGTRYAFPKDFDTVGLWYNKKLFKEAGVDFPDDSWTWDDMLAAAKKLTDRDKGVYGIAARPDPQSWYYNLVPQAGGEIISEDRRSSGYGSEGSVEAFQFMSDMINKHKVSPTLGQMSETEPRQMFQSGKLAMHYDGSFAAIELHNTEYTRKNADVAMLPEGPEQRASVIHGVGQAISKETEHPDEAKDFVKFMVGEQGARIQGDTGTTIPALEGGHQAWMDTMPQYNLQAFLDEVEHTYPYPTSRDAPKWNELEAELVPAALKGDRPTADVCADLSDRMDKVLADEKD